MLSSFWIYCTFEGKHNNYTINVGGKMSWLLYGEEECKCLGVAMILFINVYLLKHKKHGFCFQFCDVLEVVCCVHKMI
jgi:hypothetical protein